MIEVDKFELFDGIDTTVHVKPCRRCQEKNGEIVTPEFRWFSDDVNFVNYYLINCPVCFDVYGRSGMSENERNIRSMEEKWNDWNRPLEEWEDELNW